MRLLKRINIVARKIRDIYRYAYDTKNNNRITGLMFVFTCVTPRQPFEKFLACPLFPVTRYFNVQASRSLY